MDWPLITKPTRFLPPLEDIAVLLVSPTPEVGDSLEQIPNLTLTLMTPQDYDPIAVASRLRVHLHPLSPDCARSTASDCQQPFFCRRTTTRSSPSGQSAQQPTLTHWTHGHPLTSYVAFPLLIPAYAQSLHPAGWNTPIIESTVGPLLLAGERAGQALCRDRIRPFALPGNAQPAGLHLNAEYLRLALGPGLAIHAV